jgi:uncharacterized repeat protein (TIGR01451 family)
MLVGALSRKIGRKIGRNVAMAACMACCELAVGGESAAAAQKVVTKNATDNALDIRLERSKVVIVAGKESLEDASTAKPGDVLQDLATYTNKSSRTLSGVVATLPVPLNTELVMNTVTPAARASVDGTNFFAVPLKRKVKQASGVEVEQAVALSEYRYLRWYPGELEPKQSIVFSARFKVAEGAAGVNGVNVTVKK